MSTITAPKHRRRTLKRVDPLRRLRSSWPSRGLVASSQLTSPAFAASYSGKLTNTAKAGSHSATLAKGPVKAVLKFTASPAVPEEQDPHRQAGHEDSAGRIVAQKWGASPVTINTTASAAGKYSFAVSSAWNLAKRSISYTLSVTQPTSRRRRPGPDADADSDADPDADPDADADADADADPDADSDADADAHPDADADADPDSRAAGGSLAKQVCGTWVLYQVQSTTELTRLRPQIEDALALPGVVGFSVRFPWDAADITGSATSHPILDTA